MNIHVPIQNEMLLFAGAQGIAGTENWNYPSKPSNWWFPFRDSLISFPHTHRTDRKFLMVQNIERTSTSWGRGLGAVEIPHGREGVVGHEDHAVPREAVGSLREARIWIPPALPQSGPSPLKLF